MDEQLTKKERRALAKQEKVELRQKSESLSKLKKFAIWAVVLAVVGFLGYKLVNYFSSPVSSAPPEALSISDNDWVRGNKDAKAVLVEFGDFQCPACGSYYPLVKQLEQDFPDNLAVVWRHFPLVSIHKNAYNSAKAAEASGKQGKFWEMHDILFEKQDEWSDLSNPQDKFAGYAEEIGLNKDQFLSDYKNSDIEAKITSDLRLGNSLGVNATPTFFLKGKKLNNPRGYDEFKSIVQAALDAN